MSPKSWRNLMRASHLVVGAVAAVAVYAVGVVSATSARIMVMVAIPLLLLTGLGLWKQAQLRRAFRSRD